MNDEINKERVALCPQCSSPLMDEYGYYYQKSGIRIQKYICGECDYVFTSNYKRCAGLNPKTKHWILKKDLPKL